MFRCHYIAFLAAALVLAACQTDNLGADRAVATVGDVQSSGLGENQIVKGGSKLTTSGPGVLLDAWAGSNIVDSMDKADQLRSRQAEKRAFNAPLNQTVTWNNPDSGNYGTIVPVHDGYDDSGFFCREFRQTVTLGGQQQNGSVTACQQSGGSWKIQSPGINDQKKSSFLIKNNSLLSRNA